MLLPTEEASAVCPETRASGERGKTPAMNCICLHFRQFSLFVQKYIYIYLNVCIHFSSFVNFSLQDVSELRNELQRKEMLVQKHLTKLHHWQQVLEDVSGQHRKPSDLPPPGPLAFLEQASANLPPAPLKPN